MSARTNVYILAVSVGSQTYFKFGICGDIDKRISQLQTGNPHDIEFVTAISCPTKEIARAVDRDAHSYLKRFKTKGEWFCCSYDDAVQALPVAFYVNRHLTNITSMSSILSLLGASSEAA